jgi:RNA polymerase sigma factor (sigma-70 family)
LKGNPKAQEILYNKYKIIVKNFIKSKYSNINDIDDDVSEIMIKVIMNLESFDVNKSKFKSWVFSIAKNYMIDKWRNNSITLTGNNTNCVISYTTGDSYYDNISTSYINATSDMFTNSTSINNTADYDFENCSSISYITNQLTPQDYTLLNMKYIQGYNYNEIGCEFNLTSSTISNRINYIKTKLKKDNPEIIYE